MNLHFMAPVGSSSTIHFHYKMSSFFFASEREDICEFEHFSFAPLIYYLSAKHAGCIIWSCSEIDYQVRLGNLISLACSVATGL